MGTIVEIQRKKGMSYRAEVRRKGHRPLCKTFQRKSDAQRWINEQEAIIYKGGTVTLEIDRKTVADMIQRFASEKLSRMKASAQQSYGGQLAWWQKQLGHLTLRQLNRSQISQARETLRKETFTRGREHKARSNATVNRYLAALSSCCAYAVEVGLLENNPCIGIRSLPEPRGRIRFLSDDEYHRLMVVIRAGSPQLHLAVTLALSTGARQSEVMELRWKNVDLKNGYLTFGETKNGDIRIAPIVGEVLELLKQYHSDHKNNGRDEIFPSRIAGQSLNLRKQWEAAVKEAKIEDFRWHDLRHSCASYFVRQGVGIRHVAELLGHKTLQMTMRYSHLEKEHLRHVLGEAMSRPREV